MSTAGVAAQEIRVPLKTGFLHNGQTLGNAKTCWGGRSEFEKTFLNMDPITMAYSLSSAVPPEHPPSVSLKSCLSDDMKNCLQEAGSLHGTLVKSGKRLLK